jgi:hypothetical protein
VPHLERLHHCGLGVVGEVGGALEGDEAVPAATRFVDGAQNGGRPADVFQGQLEERFPRIIGTGVKQGAQLAVVALGAGDRLGEDRRV